MTVLLSCAMYTFYYLLNFLVVVTAANVSRQRSSVISRDNSFSQLAEFLSQVIEFVVLPLK